MMSVLFFVVFICIKRRTEMFIEWTSLKIRLLLTHIYENMTTDYLTSPISLSKDIFNYHIFFASFTFQINLFLWYICSSFFSQEQKRNDIKEDILNYFIAKKWLKLVQLFVNKYIYLIWNIQSIKNAMTL